VKRIHTLLFGLLAFAAGRLEAEDVLDRVDEALTFSAFKEEFRVRVSGLIDLEEYGFKQPAPGLIYTDRESLFNQRFTFFVDSQVGEHIYLFTQARVDHGFDPSDDPFQARMDEYALRVTPWNDGRLSLQVGKYGTVVGSWGPRHLSWENPFVMAPLPYENLTAIRDSAAPASASEFSRNLSYYKYEYNPLIWGPDYGTGASVAGSVGRFDYAAEIKNSALSARPESWDATSVGFGNPTFSGRIGYRPNVMWNLGFSASEGPYLRPEAQPTLPAGTGIGDFREIVLGQDVSFAWHHLQLWMELYQARFQVPRIGNADLLAYYFEAKYKFAPKIYGAVRWNQQFFGDVPNSNGGYSPWGQDIWRTDVAVGYRFTAHLQLKLQYSFQHEEDAPRDIDHILAAQFTVKY
jgi:hypothetical protein